MISKDAAQYDAFMAGAISQARQAMSAGDVPVGAVVVRDGCVIAAAHNRSAIEADPTAHAEILAIRSAASAVGDWRLTGCTMVVTLEPCCMCAAALVLARVERLVYGADDPKAGAVRSLYTICSDERLNHRLEVIGGLRADECGRMLSEFFRARRATGR